MPLFFASVGAAVEIGSLADPWTLLVGGLLIVVAIAGKMAAGYAPFWFRGNKTVIGVGMVPRGEVGLIFAQVGLQSSPSGRRHRTPAERWPVQRRHAHGSGHDVPGAAAAEDSVPPVAG